MDPTDRWQPIAPASDEPGAHQRLALGTRKRRQAVAVACTPCRSGKAKCDGTRPICTRCKDNDLVCQYDVPEGVSRAERMKLLKRDSLSSRVDEMERVIYFLRSGSDIEASTILARLRLGERMEEIIKDFPTPPFPATGGAPISLPTQDSTSGSGVSQGSPAPISDSARPSGSQLDSASSYTSSALKRPSWPDPNTITTSRALSERGKQPAVATEVDSRTFIFPLFDRDDYLLAQSDNEHEEDGSDGEFDQLVDPRLLQDAQRPPTGPPMDKPRVQNSSPEKEQLMRRLEGEFRSIHATHHQRQPIVNNIRIHNNFDIRNFFSNLPSSNTAGASNHAVDSLETQANNLFLPTWAMMTVNSKPGPGSLKYAFAGVLERGTAMIGMGTPVELVIETHPNIAALFDGEQYHESGVISKWAASMVHSVLLKGNDFTSFAYMYLCWCLMRWMISPSPETYELIPEWFRPTPNQLLMPHTNILDFVIWPAFRDFSAQIPAMQERMEWLMDMSNTLQCSWPFTLDEALLKLDGVNPVDLSGTAKAHLRDLSNWSVGPSFRGYISNADSYVRIRVDDA